MNEVKPVPARDIVDTFDAVETALTDLRLSLSIVPNALTLTLLALMPDIFRRREGQA
jgi:hypothetical protein